MLQQVGVNHGRHFSFSFLINLLCKFWNLSTCCQHWSSFGFITVAYYPSWDPWAKRNRRKRRQHVPLGVGEEVKAGKKWNECDILWIMLQRTEDPPPLTFFSAVFIHLLHCATWRPEETACKTTPLFIFLLFPSAGHTYSFVFAVHVFVCMCESIRMCMHMCKHCGKYLNTKMHNLYSSTLLKIIMSWYQHANWACDNKHQTDE